MAMADISSLVYKDNLWEYFIMDVDKMVNEIQKYAKLYDVQIKESG